MLDFFPGLKKEQLPGGVGWAVEFLTLATHSGTHLDAPYHYHPTMDQGKPATTIDEIPLEWCFSNGVLLDFRHKADGERITAQDVKRELGRIQYEIKPLDIVLVQTGADAFWGKPEYLIKGAGMDRESTLYLTEKGSRWSESTPGAGTGPCLTWQRSSRKKEIPRWSGRRTLPVSKSVTATWRTGQSVGHRQAPRLYGLLFSHQNQKGLRRLGSAGCHCGRMKETPRSLAVDILNRIDEAGLFAEPLLDQACPGTG